MEQDPAIAVEHTPTTLLGKQPRKRPHAWTGSVPKRVDQALLLDTIV